MRSLLIATRNAGKVPEIKEALRELPFSLLTMRDVPELPSDFEVEETEDSFEGNAVLKAKTLGEKTGLLTLSDDSGLEVDALYGAPGVYSARYAPGTDIDRWQKLLLEMRDIPDEKRGAQFRSVIALYDPMMQKVYTCEGVVRGIILREAKREREFGYDPVFFVPESGKTFSEMSVAEKNVVSHRGKALRLSRAILEENFSA